MHFVIRNELFGPIPPCSLELRPLTLLTGGDKAGMGLLLRSAFFLTHLGSLLQMLWERETDDGSSVLDQPAALQNHLATQAFLGLLAGQDFNLLPGAVLCCAGTEVVVGPTLTIRKIGKGLQSLLFAKERIFARLEPRPLARSSLGLVMEVLHKSQVLLTRKEPQLRVVEQPELAADPVDQRGEVVRLASWVHEGHQVLVSTHEPLVIQVLNNLLQASLLPPREIQGMPRPSHRLPFARVMVYHLTPESLPQPIIAQGHIREDMAGLACRELSDQRERINLWIRSLGEEGQQRAGNER